ncbi:MAG: DMT family transporter [Eubacteriales bacterium]|nr:DMT family transporter [Eubacteriales bacterium]
MTSKNKAILCIILSAFFFALMSFFVRLSGDVPTVQKSFFRNAIAALCALPIFLKKHQTFNIGKDRLTTLFFRSLCGTLGLLLNYYSIDHMNLSDANMLNKLSPFFAILASIFILSEIPKKTDWAAVVIAFAGALLILKPSFNMQFFYGMTAAVGGLFTGIAYTLVRKLGTDGVDSSVIILGFSTFSCLFALPPSFFYGFHMTMTQLGILVLAGVSAAAAQFAITTAYTLAPAKNISVFEYTQIIFAALLGMAFLGQLPDALSFLGYAIIIASAVLKQKFSD